MQKDMTKEEFAAHIVNYGCCDIDDKIIPYDIVRDLLVEIYGHEGTVWEGQHSKLLNEIKTLKTNRTLFPNSIYNEHLVLIRDLLNCYDVRDYLPIERLIVLLRNDYVLNACYETELISNITAVQILLGSIEGVNEIVDIVEGIRKHLINTFTTARLLSKSLETLNKIRPVQPMMTTNTFSN